MKEVGETEKMLRRRRRRRGECARQCVRRRKEIRIENILMLVLLHLRTVSGRTGSELVGLEFLNPIPKCNKAPVKLFIYLKSVY